MLRLIGDVHCNLRSYLALCEGAEYTLQLGDLCSQTYKPLSSLDSEKNKAFAGNHDLLDRDDPQYFGNDPHFLGDFGLHNVPELGNIFYVRGAFSIDSVRENEEIDESLHDACVELYAETKPEILVAHQAPDFLSATFGDVSMLRSFGFSKEPVTKTGMLLARMFTVREPKLFVCGHYHKRTEVQVNKTHCICLDMIRQNAPAELCYLDVDREYLDSLDQ